MLLLAVSVTLSKPLDTGIEIEPNPPLKFSISRLIILPPSPVPLTIPRSTPFSSANFLAKGEAINLPFKLWGITDFWGWAVIGFTVTFFSSSLTRGGLSTTGVAVLTSLAKFSLSAALTSSGSVPSLPIAAKTESTGAEAPSSKPI